MTDWVNALVHILSLFDRLGIPYMIGGSLASSAIGVWRATQDIDIVADLTTDAIDLLARELQEDYYADAETMRDALTQGRPFSIIHYGSSFKFDIFPLPKDPYYQTEISRRVRTEIRIDKDRVLSFWTATPEDIILAKLLWYREGGEISDRQWSDIRGVITVRSQLLDLVYLNEWASHLNVSALLERALQQ
jgi:hypothetical protein